MYITYEYVYLETLPCYCYVWGGTGFPTMYVHTVQCVPTVYSVCLRCTPTVHSVYIQCTVCAYTMHSVYLHCTVCSYSVQCVPTLCIYSVPTLYILSHSMLIQMKNH